VPGLFLAERFLRDHLVLLDSAQRRCSFLEECVRQAGWSQRVEVRCGRAEELARDPLLRGSFDAVVSRSFGPPAVAAECGSAFLELEGVLVVSEPPGDGVSRTNSPGSSGPGRKDEERPRRWDSQGLTRLGLRVVETLDEPFHFVILCQERPCPDEFPRRVGVPSKRPLF
jgi:16S rRNA (guanine527-N7)-methyltransferase